MYALAARVDVDADTTDVEDFLGEITRDDRPADKKILEEMLGDCLTPHYRRRWIGMLYGPGANGKSVFLNCGRAMLGSENVSAVKLDKLVNNRFAGYDIVREGGKLANMSAEISGNKISDSTT